MNVGGPNLKLRVGHMLSLGVGAFPSLLIVDSKAEPKLGLSPRLDYGKLLSSAPAYHRASDHSWLWTYGFGYKFH